MAETSAIEPTAGRCVHWRMMVRALAEAPKVPGTDLRVVRVEEWPSWPDEETQACPDPCHGAPLAVADVMVVTTSPLVADTCGERRGSCAGYMRHRRKGEVPCPDCYRGWNHYRAERRAAKRDLRSSSSGLVWSEPPLPGLRRV